MPSWNKDLGAEHLRRLPGRQVSRSSWGKRVQRLRCGDIPKQYKAGRLHELRGGQKRLQHRGPANGECGLCKVRGRKVPRTDRDGCMRCMRTGQILRGHRGCSVFKLPRRAIHGQYTEHGGLGLQVHSRVLRGRGVKYVYEMRGGQVQRPSFRCSHSLPILQAYRRQLREIGLLLAGRLDGLDRVYFLDSPLESQIYLDCQCRRE